MGSLKIVATLWFNLYIYIFLIKFVSLFIFPYLTLNAIPNMFIKKNANQVQHTLLQAYQQVCICSAQGQIYSLFFA